MTRALPPRPSLEQLKKQAKDLRRAHQSASPEAAERIKAHLPRLSGATEEEILQGDFSLQEAQHLIACEYGFKHWEMLCRVVAADLDMLAGLSDQHIQELLREIDQKDFIRAFQGAGSIVSARFLGTMSARVRTFFREEMEAQQDLAAAERLEARRRILDRAARMAAQGRIVWPEAVALDGMERTVERLDFDLLAGLEDQSAQRLLRQVDQKDLVAALAGASEAVRARFLGTMSARVRSFLESEIGFSKAQPDYIQSVQRRILVQAGGLAAQGILQWPGGNGTPAPPPGPQGEVPEKLRASIARPLDQLAPGELTELWLGIAEQARKEGILSLQSIEEETRGPFLREALQLMVDGTEPELVRDILETRLRRAILPQQETRCRMIIEAVMAIQSGDNPGIIRHKMGAIYLAQPDALPKDERSAESSAGELAARLRREPVAQMDFDRIAELMTDLGSLARRESIRAFEALPRVLEGRRDMASEVLRRGLEMMLAGTPPDQMMRALETQVEARLAGWEKAHRMVIEGAMGTQAGKEPEEVAARVRQVGV